MPDTFLETRCSFQAREILAALEKHGSGNEALFYTWLGRIGLGTSHSDLAALIDRLEAAGLVITERVDQYCVVRPTRAGNEVAQARPRVDWIASANID